jgi:hypothetical protein
LTDFKKQLEYLLGILRSDWGTVGAQDHVVLVELIKLLIERERIPQGARERIAQGWKDD